MREAREMLAMKRFMARAGFAMILFVLGSALQPAWGRTCNSINTK